MPSEKSKKPSRYRELNNFTSKCCIGLTVIGILIVTIYTFHFGVSIWGSYLVGTAYLHLILALFLPLVFIHFPFSARFKNTLPWWDILIVLLSFAAPFHFFLHGEEILDLGWEIIPPPTEFALGLILWIIVLEAARRTVGFVLCLLVLCFSIYPLFASYMPSIFFGPNFELSRLIGYNIMGPEGVIGLPTRVLANLFIGFLIFGVALTYTGASKFFLDLALSIFGTVRGGTAKVAVISSAMVGSISGSVITNVITTGSFTIPAMRRIGYPNYYAAAIEACASSGGVIMPPIMGAAAFVMAGVLNISYAQVAIAAAVPSILYYLGLFVQIDGYAAKNNLQGIPRSELPKFTMVIKEGWYYIFAFAVLFFVLFVLRRESQAPFYATIPLFLSSMIDKKSRLSVKDFINFLLQAGRVLGEITGILCSIGLLIGALLLTGTAQSLSTELIELSGGNSLMLVGLGAIASFILGMGLSITACYLLLAVLLAPALVQSGFHDLSVHIFLIYTGVLSFITPPVAIGAYAAAAVAESKPMTTAFQAVRLGLILFIIPFFIIFQPSLILHGDLAVIVESIFTAIIGVILIGSAMEGYLILIGNIGVITRVIVFISGLMLFLPETITNLTGAVVIILLYAAHYLKFVAMPIKIDDTRKKLHDIQTE